MGAEAYALCSADLPGGEGRADRARGRAPAARAGRVASGCARWPARRTSSTPRRRSAYEPAGDPAAPEGPERAHRARDDPRRRRRSRAPRSRATPASRSRPSRSRCSRWSTSGWSGAPSPTATALATARPSSSRWPRPPRVLGLDLGARFLRGGVCDLSGEVRARAGRGARRGGRERGLRGCGRARRAPVDASGVPRERVQAAVVGVPGVVNGDSGRISLADNIHGLDGLEVGAELCRRLGDGGRRWRTT